MRKEIFKQVCSPHFPSTHTVLLSLSWILQRSHNDKFVTLALFPWQLAVMAEWQLYSKIKWYKGRGTTSSFSLKPLKNRTRHSTEGGAIPQKSRTLQGSFLQLYSHLEFLVGLQGPSPPSLGVKWSFSRVQLHGPRQHGGTRGTGEPLRLGLASPLSRARGLQGSCTTLGLVERIWFSPKTHGFKTGMTKRWIWCLPSQVVHYMSLKVFFYFS